jgi:hypothetical protein
VYIGLLQSIVEQNGERCAIVMLTEDRSVYNQQLFDCVVIGTEKNGFDVKKDTHKKP